MNSDDLPEGSYTTTIFDGPLPEKWRRINNGDVFVRLHEGHIEIATPNRPPRTIQINDQRYNVPANWNNINITVRAVCAPPERNYGGAGGGWGPSRFDVGSGGGAGGG